MQLPIAKEIYDSAWHIPAIPWIASCALLLALARSSRPQPRRGFFAVFAVVIAADAALTGPLAPSMPSALATFFGVAFVVLGDARYFFLTLSTFMTDRRAAAGAGALAFVVPVLSQALRVALPERFAGGRALFLGYELCFLVVLGLFCGIARKRTIAGTRGREIFDTLARYEAVQYALWASADIVILSGHASGFALRILPNVAYYAGFLWFARERLRFFSS